MVDKLTHKTTQPMVLTFTLNPSSSGTKNKMVLWLDTHDQA
jgi:hypothetical protein